MKYLVLILLVGFYVASYAADSKDGTAATETSIEKVKKRLYPGGADEEDLKVLEQLPEATIKVTPASVQKQVLGDVIESSPEDAPTDGE